MGLFMVQELREVISVKVLAGQGLVIGQASDQTDQYGFASPFAAAISLSPSEAIDSMDMSSCRPCLRKARQELLFTMNTAFRQTPPRYAGLDGRSAPFSLQRRDNSLFADQQLATHHRSRFHIPVVAVTGSNGKTTMKDMVAAVLAQRWSVLKTEGNFNNRIGVPYTLFRLTSRHQTAVIEMGVDQQGQTTRLCEIVRPTIGMITNIGPDHLEFFGSMEGSAQAKAELLDMLPAYGTAILNADDPYFDDSLQARNAASCRSDFRRWPMSARAWSCPMFARERPFACTSLERARPTPVRIKVHGTHNVTNALAAAAVGAALNLSGSMIAQGLGRFRPAAMRSQVVTHHGVHIINDCYNANPASMKAALQLLAQWSPARERIAVLGDMLELGPEARQMHREVGQVLATQGLSRLIVCGALGRDIAEGARRGGMAESQIDEVADAATAADHLKSIVRQGDVVLVKASRGMKMEQIVQVLTGMRAVIKQAS